MLHYTSTTAQLADRYGPQVLVSVSSEYGLRTGHRRNHLRAVAIAQLSGRGPQFLDLFVQPDQHGSRPAPEDSALHRSVRPKPDSTQGQEREVQRSHAFPFRRRGPSPDRAHVQPEGDASRLLPRWDSRSRPGLAASQSPASDRRQARRCRGLGGRAQGVP